MKTTNFFSALTLIMILAGCTQTNESPVISMDHSWRFKPGDDLSWAECDINDSSWALISPHKPWERQGYKGVNGYAWYRCKVIIPSALKEGGYFHDTLQISLGKIDDCDQVFLNGKLIGENTEGTDVRSFTIEVGDLISLTPPMGWNSWNCQGLSVSDEKVRSSARAMKESGLIDHGWSYINIDDGCEDTHVDGTIPICSSLDGWEFYQIWAKEMEDGNTAIGIFNLTESPRNQEVNLDELGDGGYYEIRDLWTQRDLGKVERFFQIRVEPHGARMILLKKAGKIFS